MVAVMGAFAVLGVAVLSGVQTGLGSKLVFDIQSEAENIARNQMEDVFAQPYVPPGGTYQVISTLAAYDVTVQSLPFNATSTDISTVRITVGRDGKTLKVLETFRAER